MPARLLALRKHISDSHSILANPTLWRPLSTMALNLTGTCTCKNLQYTVKLESADEGRTTLCHCSSCKKAFGTNYGLTSKIPIESFKYSKGEPKLFSKTMAWGGSSVTTAAPSSVNTERQQRTSSVTLHMALWMILSSCRRRASSSARPDRGGCPSYPICITYSLTVPWSSVRHVDTLSVDTFQKQEIKE